MKTQPSFCMREKKNSKVAGAAGFEPTNHGVKVRCLATWLYPIIKSVCYTLSVSFKKIVVSPQGFEPRTHGLEGRCSIQLSYGPTWSG